MGSVLAEALDSNFLLHRHWEAVLMAEVTCVGDPERPVVLLIIILLVTFKSVALIQQFKDTVSAQLGRHITLRN